MINRFIITLFLILSIIASNAQINIKFKDVLEGKAPLDLVTVRNAYNAFVSKYWEKSEERFEIFKKTFKGIHYHNSNPLKTWSKGINDFSDCTEQQFLKMTLMEPQNCSATQYNLRVKKDLKISAPNYWNWRNFGMVSPVKNQGHCGSCWTFSTIGSLQAHWNILKKGKNKTFSQQQLVDCAGDFDNHGCQGGLPSHAFEYIRYAGGIESEDSYPYKAVDGKCNFDTSKISGYVKYGSFNITRGDENQLKQRLYRAGPVSVAYQVKGDFRDYKTGVYTNKNCGTLPHDVNHAVLAVGYGNQKGVDYWYIKNSWGKTWGDEGFFKIERGKNMCAIGQCNSYPLIDSKSTDLQEVPKQKQASQ